jgi:hypothetical protein
MTSPSAPSRSHTASTGATRPTRPTPGVPKLRYIVVTLSGIFSILGIQLLLSIAVSGGAYEISALKGEMRKSHQELQIVAEDISALNSPGTLAGLATAMGMVADNNPAYLRLSDGVVIGEAQPAAAVSGPTIYAVTAGGEGAEPPAIVTSVMNAVTHNLASLGMENDEELAPVVFEPVAPVTATTVATTPVATTPVATPAPTPVTTQVSTPRLGGTIPSPVTR